MAVAHISELVLCRKCLGPTGRLDENCPRCGGIDSVHWGTDPVSLRGCCVDADDLDNEAEERLGGTWQRGDSPLAASRQLPLKCDGSPADHTQRNTSGGQRESPLWGYRTTRGSLSAVLSGIT